MELGRFKGMGDSTTIRTLFEQLWLPEPSAGWAPPGDDLLAHAQWVKGYEEGMPFAVPDLYADGAFIDGGPRSPVLVVRWWPYRQVVTAWAQGQ
eukprot:1836427-Pyramimonas_sp.AAC.1